MRIEENLDLFIKFVHLFKRVSRVSNRNSPQKICSGNDGMTWRSGSFSQGLNRLHYFHLGFVRQTSPNCDFSVGIQKTHLLLFLNFCRNKHVLTFPLKLLAGVCVSSWSTKPHSWWGSRAWGGKKNSGLHPAVLTHILYTQRNTHWVKLNLWRLITFNTKTEQRQTGG